MITRLAVISLSALSALGPGGSRAPAQPAGPAPGLNAEYVRMQIPEKVRTHDVFRAAVTMRNTGAGTWGEGFSLFSQAPANNTTWGTHYIILGQGRKILPGQEATFSSWLKAPAAPGRHAFVWRAGNRKGLFGRPTERKIIVVEERAGEPEAWPEIKPAAPDASGKRVLTFADFEYAGSFKVPRKVAGKESVWSASGLSLRKMPDGTRRLFMSYGAVFEVEVPELVKLIGGDHRPLKTAEVKKVWGPLSVAGRDGKAISANAEFWWDEDAGLLYWSSYHGYWTGPARPLLAASKLAADGTVTHLGPWRAAAACYKSYWGGVTPLPKGFADRYAGGRPLAIGFGGYYSICASTSQGPALAAIARPDPAKPALDTLELLCRPWGKHGGAPRDGDYVVANCGWGGRQPAGPGKGWWTMEDVVRSGVFIDLADAHAYIAFAYLGTGRMGYDYGHITSAGDADWWYVYDPADLGAAATGAVKCWQVTPHSRTKVEYPLAAKARGRTPTAPVYGSCFDDKRRLLYLFKPFSVDNRFPCVHVYRVKQP